MDPRRGMRRVHLVEARPEMGGIVNWVSRLPGLGEVGPGGLWTIGRSNLARHACASSSRTPPSAPVTCWSRSGSRRRGTGAHWATDGLNGITRGRTVRADASLEHCLTPEQIMEYGKEPGERVLVYDCEGYYLGVSLAEKLALDGKSVTLVSPLAEIAPFTAFTHERQGICKNLKQLGVSLVSGHLVDQVMGRRRLWARYLRSR